MMAYGRESVMAGVLLAGWRVGMLAHRARLASRQRLRWQATTEISAAAAAGEGGNGGGGGRGAAGTQTTTQMWSTIILKSNHHDS